jgi:microcystin-dependent protein
MSSPFIGEMRITSFNFAPKGWAQCNGQLMPIAQNQAMFSILGTTYGGDGQSTFQLPNLQGRTPMHVGNNVTRGGAGGEVAHTLTGLETPTHSHFINVTNVAGTSANPTGNFFANSNVQPYRTDQNTTMSADTVTNTGGGQAHNNMQPYLVLNIIIALQGIFPSQN